MLLTILSGLSGSGKSTYINLLCGGAVVCSADTFFMVDGQYRFDVSKLSQAHGACFKGAIDALQRGEDHVVIDNTCTSSEEIAPYVLLAQAFGYEAEIVTLVAPKGMTEGDYIAACADRNAHNVPPHAVAGQAKALANRRLMPWWKSETVESQF
jgi:predicted kinase